MLAAAFVGVPGYYEVEWVVVRYGGLTVVCTPGWGSIAGGPINAGHNQRTLEGFCGQTVAYYYTPGRLAVFRQQFENAHRRPGLDPATFATELGILALRGFSDMKEKARVLMVRNKFIAAQQSCDLHRHLDSAAPETSIGDTVDSCRIWESHAEPIAIDNWCQDPVYSQPTLLMPPPATGGSAQLRYRAGSVMPALNESPRRVRHSSADRELLIRNVLEAVGARQNVMSERLRSSELELLLRDMPPYAVYVRWQTGLLVSSDWLRPVTWGGWRADFPDRGRGSADVS